MRKVNIFVKDKNTLVLNEDANKVDYIDLTELATVDTSAIEASIDAAKDKVYQQKLEDFKKSLVAEAKLEKEQLNKELQLKIQNLEAELVKTKELNVQNLNAKDKEKEDALSLKTNEIEQAYQDQINDLNQRVVSQQLKHENELAEQKNALEATFKDEIAKLNEKLATYEADKNALITSIKAKNAEEINNLKNKYSNDLQTESKKLEASQNEYNILKAKYDSDIKNKELELNSKYQSEIAELKKDNELIKVNNQTTIDKLNIEHQKAIEDTKHQYDDRIRILNDTVLGLQRQRNSLTSKLIGEDLEEWCSKEALSYMQNGLLNCTWTKDNVVVRDAGQVKGTKGDFIFNIYATEEHKEDELLANMLLEMKNESTNGKTKNHEHFAKLDQDRLKKHCKYAVLVSDLERENNNDLPMFRVPGYKDMYVVRPEYMMTFINIMASITVKFVDLVLKKTQEELTLKTKKEILEEFDAIKDSYLNGQLKSLASDIDDIEKATNSIITSANKINNSIEHVRLQYIQKIERKLENYTPRLNKILKRIEE